MQYKYFTRIALCIAAASMMSGCSIYKSFKMPTDTEATRTYAEAAAMEEDSTAFGNLKWQDVFTDPLLAGYIQQALDNNVDLANAKLNVDIANARLKGARMAYLPSLSLSASGGKAYYDYAGMRDLNWTYQIPLSASWEIDIFGKLLNAKRSAKAALLQSEAYHQAVRSQIIGGVANCYYSIAMLQKQLEISRRTAENWRETIDIMKDFKEAGRVNETAVVQQTANYYSILASIKDLETSLNDANSTFSLLLNTERREDWGISPDASFALPEIYSRGIEMRELASRPDVKAAEQNLAIAYYATNQARAAFYPGLNISATGGITNSLGSMVVNPANWFAQLAGSLTAPLFARGQLITGLKTAKKQQEQALNNFQYTLLSASNEVGNALHLYTKNYEKQELLAKQVENLSKAVDYTQELLALDGTSTYLEVITAQQSLLAAQLSEATCRNTVARAAVSFYQSLGGGR